MLVESPDGSAALLGRSKKMRPGMLTCLSGFIDQVGGSAAPLAPRELPAALAVFRGMHTPKAASAVLRMALRS